MLGLIEHPKFLAWYMGISSVLSIMPLVMSVFWMGLGIPHWFFLFYLIYGSFKDNELQRWFLGCMVLYYALVMGFLLLIVSEIFIHRARFQFNLEDLLELQVVALYFTVPLGILVLLFKFIHSFRYEKETE